MLNGYQYMEFGFETVFTSSFNDFTYLNYNIDRLIKVIIDG